MQPAATARGAASHTSTSPGAVRMRGIAWVDRKDVAVELHGQKGEQVACHLSVRRQHGGSDRAAVLDWTGSSAQAQALVNLWQVLAEEVVEHRWPPIQRVAAGLLKRETPTEAEVRSSRCSASRRGGFSAADVQGGGA